MLSVPLPLETETVRPTGRRLDHVVKVMPFAGAWPGRLSCASYWVPGVRFTSEPRHSPCELSYQSARPWVHAELPTGRNLTSQPVPLFAPGGADQYRPTAS